MHGRSILMMLFVGVLAAASTGCGGEAELAASFDYEMPARFVVPELRAPEDQLEYDVYVEGPLQPDAWRVPFDACGSTGSPVRYVWRIDGEEVAVETRCDGFEYEFPTEGEYSVSLMVEDGSGEQMEESQVNNELCSHVQITPEVSRRLSGR